MQNYLELLEDILENGTEKGDRTGTGTLSVFGRQLRWDLREYFPALTLKKLYTRTLRVELIWFLGNHLQDEHYKRFGRTNIKFLVDNNCNIWNDWPYKHYCREVENNPLYLGRTISQDEFVELIKVSDEFAMEWGNLGPVYGKQWRDWEEIAINDDTIFHIHHDQIDDAIYMLKNDPDSRRILVNAWNVGNIAEMQIAGLPPCHTGFQFYSEVIDGERYLSLKWEQRSVDVAAGLPFNIASYGLLLHMVAQVTDHKVKELIADLGDTHIYSNHIEAAKEMISREPLEHCSLEINPDVSSIDDFKIDDFKFINYKSHPPIKLPIAV